MSGIRGESKRGITLLIGVGVVLLCVVLAVWAWHQSELGSQPQAPHGGISATEPRLSTEHAQMAESSHTLKPVQEAKAERPRPPETSVQTAEQSIRGTVWRDEAHREPAASVSVMAKGTLIGGIRATAKTDASGRFVLPIALPDTQYSVFAEDEATGLVSLKCPVVLVGRGKPVENVDLLLAKGVGTISGHVFSETHTYSAARIAGIQTKRAFYEIAPEELEQSAQRPFAGVNVVLTGRDKLPLTRTAVTDAQGFYRFTGLPKGSYEVVPETPTGAVMARPPMPGSGPEQRKPGVEYVELKDPEAMNAEKVDFSLRVDGLSLTGNVSDTQHRPLAGAEIVVQVSQQNMAGEGYSLGTVTTTSDQAGNYRVDGLPTMGLQEAMGFMSYGFPEVNYVVRAKARGFETLQREVPGISQDLAQTASTMVTAAVQLGVQGFKNLRPGTPPKMQGRVISGVDFVLPVGVAVSGILVDINGKALANHAIGIRPVSSGKESADRLPGESALHTTDAYGSFSFEGLPAGNYTFYTYVHSHPNFISATNEPLKLAAGDAVTGYVVSVDLNIPLPPNAPTPKQAEDTPDPTKGTIEGTITFNGNAADATLALYAEGQDHASSTGYSKETGHYTLTNVEPGHYTVVASRGKADGRTRHLAKQAATVEAGRITRVDFAFEGSATLRGAFTFPSAIRKTSIVVREPGTAAEAISSDGKELYEQAVAGTFVMESGDYQIDELPAGDFVVTGVGYGFGDDDEYRLFHSPSHKVHLEPGASSTLDLELGQ